MRNIQQFLCQEGIVKTFREAKDLINAGLVKVNDEIVDHSYVLIVGDLIVVNKNRRVITMNYPTSEPVISVSKPTKQAYMYQHLSAGSDANGNPRRVFIIMDANGNILKAIDEEYKGLPAECKGLVQLPQFEVSVREYKILLKNFSE